MIGLDQNSQNQVWAVNRMLQNIRSDRAVVSNGDYSTDRNPKNAIPEGIY